MYLNEDNSINDNIQLTFIPSEFEDHVKRFHPSTIILLKKNFNNDFKDYYKRLETIYMNWPYRFLDPEFFYLLVKVGVLTGYSNRILRFREDVKAFRNHNGINAWFSAVFFREGPEKIPTAKFFLQHLKNVKEIKSNLFTEIISWKIAFEDDLDIALGLFEDKKILFTWELPYYIIVEKLMGIKRIKIAENYIDQGMSRFPKKNRLIQGRLLNKKGVIARIKGDPQRSMDYFNLALDEIQPIKGFIDIYLKSLIYFNMGTSVLRLRAYLEAEKYFTSVLEIQNSVEIEDLTSKSAVFFNLSNLFIRTGNYKKALTNLTKAEEIFTLQDPLFKKSVTISTLTRKAIIYRYLGEYSDSERILIEAIEKFESLGNNVNPIAYVEAKINLAEVKNIFGEDILASLQDLIHYCSNYDYIIGVFRILALMANIYLLNYCNINASEELLNEMKAIIANITDEKRKLDFYILEAKLQFIKGNIDEAEAILLAIIEESEEKEMRIKSSYFLGQIYLNKGDLLKSNDFFQKAFELFENKTNDYYLCEFMCIKTQILLEKTEENYGDLIKNIMKKVERMDANYTNLPSKTVINEYLLLKAWIYEELTDFRSAEKIYCNLGKNYPINMRTMCLRSKGLIKCHLLNRKSLNREIKRNSSLIKTVEKIIKKVKNSSYFFFSIEIQLLEIYLLIYLESKESAKTKIKMLKTELEQNKLVLFLGEIVRIEDILEWNTELNNKFELNLPNINEVSQILYSQIF